jgi:hypothetical protein
VHEHADSQQLQCTLDGDEYWSLRFVDIETHHPGVRR